MNEDDEAERDAVQLDAALLDALASKLDNAAMTDMNYQVDIGQQPVDKVAGDFLRGHGLI